MARALKSVEKLKAKLAETEAEAEVVLAPVKKRQAAKQAVADKKHALAKAAEAEAETTRAKHKKLKQAVADVVAQAERTAVARAEGEERLPKVLTL